MQSRYTEESVQISLGGHECIHHLVFIQYFLKLSQFGCIMCSSVCYVHVSFRCEDTRTHTASLCHTHAAFFCGARQSFESKSDCGDKSHKSMSPGSTSKRYITTAHYIMCALLCVYLCVCLCICVFVLVQYNQENMLVHVCVCVCMCNWLENILFSFISICSHLSRQLHNNNEGKFSLTE